MSDPRRIIAALRDGQGLTPEAAAEIARGLTDGSLSDAQAAAFAMAVLLRGAGAAGRVALTQAMRDSGKVLHWALPGPVVDKHSTGGVGDSVSLLLAPVLAAAGCYVPMISGRGLGHTGGTLDKLEAIPGFRVDLDEAAFRRVTAKVGCAIVAASADLAPADRRLYAIRDESATVESLDLITASILSKKLAAGLQGLVLDVKCGSGAFSPDMTTARALAEALVETANGAGCKTVACITDMDQPLARSAGNALEIREVIQSFHTGQGALVELSLALAGECLALAGIDPAKARAVFASGHAAERFAQMVHAQGGPADLLETDKAWFPPAPVERVVEAAQPGLVTAIDVAALGRVVVQLGGGRMRASDQIDPRVGLSHLRRLGEQTGPGQPLGRVHARSTAEADAAAAALRAAYQLGQADQLGEVPAAQPLMAQPLIRARIPAGSPA